MQRLRAALAATIAAALTIVLCGPSFGATDWKQSVAQLVTTPYSLNAVAYKQQLVAGLPPEATDSLGDVRVSAVAADAGTRYLDGARFLDEPNGDAAFKNDQHLAAWLASRVSTEAEISALTHLLQSTRLMADAAVQDAEVTLRDLGQPLPDVTVDSSEEPAKIDAIERGVDLLASADGSTGTGVDAAGADLDKARMHYAKGEAALGKALPVAAVTHYGLAWKYGVNALAKVGVTYEGDRDGDGVKDLLELMVGASPLRADTDGDGLTDLFEIDTLFSLSDPAKSDTDGDGTRDANEDLDADTLTAIVEQRTGTLPTEADSDHDGLDDPAEITAGSDPRKPDTDSDGLIDGAERAAGTGVLDPDSDDDGILDGDEVLHQEVRGVDGIEATLVGRGDLSTSFRVTPAVGDPRLEDAPGQVGTAYDFTVGRPAAFQQAELRMPYDPASLGDTRAADLRVFYFDTAKGLWVPAAVDQVLDTQQHVVKATVSHFSTYAIFDIKNWGETWTAQDNPCRTRSDGGTDVVLLDLALVLDSSGSMGWNDPDGLRRTASKSFVDALLPEDRAGVVDFDSWAYVAQDLTSDHAAVKSAIDTIDDSGGTNIAAGVSLGNSMLIDNGDTTRARMAILLTDGEGYYDPALTQQAVTHGITIYTIGLGSSVDTGLLSGIAEQTGGKFHHVATAAELPEVFRRISDDTGADPRAAKDTDEDGLNDCVEIEGALGGDGQRYDSDPSLKDSDGDGMEDGEEVEASTTMADLFESLGLDPSGLPTTYVVHSDPQLVDTDGDRLDDAPEADFETSSFDTDHDDDGLPDGDEVDRVASAPEVWDTDGDGHGDGYEDSHRSDQGLDPLFYDETVSSWSYASDFAKGAIAGDLWREDSLAWLAGNLASGGSSFIPVVGWIVGGIADLRDAIGSAIHADWVGSGLSVVGVLPYAGDAVAIPGKAARFILRNEDKADEVLSFVTKLDDVPTSIKTEALELGLKKYDDLVRLGFSDADLLTLAKGRTNLDDLAEAMARGGHRAVDAGAGFKATGKAGEAALEATHQATTKGLDKQVWRSTKGFIGRGRYFDVLAGGVAHESKVGFVKWSKSIENQIRKDGYLATPGGNPSSAHWHFFASSASNTLGADKRVLDLLDQLGIPYTVHVP